MDESKHDTLTLVADLLQKYSKMSAARLLVAALILFKSPAAYFFIHKASAHPLMDRSKRGDMYKCLSSDAPCTE